MDRYTLLLVDDEESGSFFAFPDSLHLHFVVHLL